MPVDSIYVPKQGRLSDLVGWIAGDLGSSRVRLYKSNTVYNPDRVPADYTEADFVGYVPKGPLAWVAPFINVVDKAETDSPVLTWNYSAGVGSQTVFGVFITDAAQTKLLAVIPFHAPILLSPANNSLSYTVQITETSEL